MTTNNRHNFKLTCLIYLFFAVLVISAFTTYEDSLDDDFDEDDLLMQSLFFKDSEISYRGSKAVYQNEFVVYVPSGMGMANEIADKHGFDNMGQVGLDSPRKNKISTFWQLSSAPLCVFWAFLRSLS